MNIKIDSEFKSLIPPLSVDERKQLEENCLKDGILDPLRVWVEKKETAYCRNCYDETNVRREDVFWQCEKCGGNTDRVECILIDGHNRFEISQAHNLTFEVVELDFESRTDVRIWIREHALGRRNLPFFVRAELITGIQKDMLLKEGKGKQGKRNDLLSNVDKKLETHNTQKELAKELGVGAGTLARAEYVIKHAPEELKEKVRQEEISVNKAYTTLVQEKRKEEAISKLREIEHADPGDFNGLYDVIVIDPPWPMQKIERDVAPNQVAFDYPTMSEAELESMDLPSAESCHLFLWTTHKFLPMAMRLTEKWGFKYVCLFTWHKPGGFQPFGLPQYNSEFVIYARKGTPFFVDTKAFKTCFDAPRTEHSAKPEEFYEMIRRVTAGRRIDIFNRRQISGFETWGKEAEVC